MKIVTAHLKSCAGSPLSQSRFHGEPKLEKETNDAYDLRTWQNKSHIDEEGHVYHPPIAFKRTLDEAAKRNGMQIPGKGKERYTKHFVSGVQVFERPYLFKANGTPLTIDDLKLGDPPMWDRSVTRDSLVQRRTLCDAQGKKGSSGGSSVVRNFPDIPEWEAAVTFHIFNETITEDVFVEMLTEAGMFVGIGVFRPENGGYYGRFSVEEIVWQ